MEARAEARENRLMARMNDVFERMSLLQRDFTNTKGFLIEDAIVNGGRITAAERRIDGLERDK
jgi:hypothetical protein